MKSNPILITHTDLDGAGSVVLMKAIFNDCEIYMCDYRNIDQTVERILLRESLLSPEEAETPIMFITDISVSKEVADKLEKRGMAKLFDHHKTALWLNEYKWAKVDTSVCGTMLFWMYLKESNFIQVEPYQNFVFHVNDYDMWKHKLPKSKDLNQLYYLLGSESFVNRMLKNPYVVFTPTEEAILEVENNRKKEYLKSCEAKVAFGHIGNFKAGYICAESYISELGQHLINKFNLDIVCIVDMNSKKVSLRSRSGVDCSLYAKKAGGGGHPQASGYVISDENFITALQAILEPIQFEFITAEVKKEDN